MVCLQNGMGMKGPADLKSARVNQMGAFGGRTTTGQQYGAKLEWGSAEVGAFQPSSAVLTR